MIDVNLLLAGGACFAAGLLLGYFAGRWRERRVFAAVLSGAAARSLLGRPPPGPRGRR